MSSLDLEFFASKFVLGLFPADKLPEVAAHALENGRDCPALRVLAGLTAGEAYEAERIFDRVLSELYLSRPTKSEAVVYLARSIAKKITIGLVTPYEGASEIWELTLVFPEGHLPELDTFVYAASEWKERPEDRRLFESGIKEAATKFLATQGDIPPPVES